MAEVSVGVNTFFPKQQGQEGAWGAFTA